MPVPTSVAVVLLVVAWLAILVPMVSRRRDAVPELEEAGSRFRVLQRTSRSERRRPHFGRRVTEDVDSDDDSGAESDEHDGDLGEELLDEDAEYADDAEYAEEDDDEHHGSRPFRASVPDGDHETDRYDETDEHAESDEYDEYDGYEETDGYDEEAGADDRFGPAGSPAHAGSHPLRSDAAGYTYADESEEFDQFDDEYDDAPGSHPYAPAAHTLEQYADPDDPDLRPVPQRRGRGGYNPQAAAARAGRVFRRRRRVTLVLLLATIAFGLAARFVTPMLWVGCAVAAILLVSYLVYLRWQVKVERDIRSRRLRKLQHARQPRPRSVGERHGGTTTDDAFLDEDDPDGDDDRFRTVAVRRPDDRRGAAAVAGRRLLDIEDDDPAFDELDYYRPAVYRRAAGQ